MDALRLGRSIRAIRVRLGWRQLDLADKASVSRALVSRLERGLLSSTTFDVAGRVCRALGADLDVRVRWRGEGLDRLLDEAHAALVDAIVALLAPAGWTASIEVTFNHYGDRGSIDVLAWHPVERALLIIEVKSVIPDAQGTLVPLDRKVRVAPFIAAERGLSPTSISRLLVVGEGTTNRMRVARFEALFRAALPMRGADVRRWLRKPTGALAGLLFLPDARPGSVRRTATGRSRVNRPRARRIGTG